MLEGQNCGSIQHLAFDVADAAAARPLRGHGRRRQRSVLYEFNVQTFFCFLKTSLFVFQNGGTGITGNGGENGENDPVSRFGVLPKTASTESRRRCRQGNTRPALRLVFKGFACGDAVALLVENMLTNPLGLNNLTGTIIDAAIGVHKETGPGLLESRLHGMSNLRVGGPQ